MPKELHEISKFMTGTITVPSETDIPDDAASYSANIDPVAEDGVLKGIPNDTYLQTNGTWGASGGSDAVVDASKLAMINNDGQRDVVYYEADTNKIHNITNLYEADGGSIGQNDMGVQTSSADEVTMQVNNKEVHIGTGNGATDKPLWCGIVPHSQFGTAATGLQLEDAELKNPSPFPDIYKAVIGSDGDYIYGIEWQGTHVYKFNIATSKVVKRSEKIFTQVQGLCLSSDGSLWVVDNLSGTMHLIKIDTENMLDTVDVTFTSTGTIANISDIIEIGTKIWFSKYGVSYGNTVNANGWGIWNDNVADFVAGASEPQTLAGKTPFRGVPSGAIGEGSWSDGHESSPTQVGVMFTVPKVALIDVGDNSKCGWVTSVDLDDDLNGTADSDGTAVRFVKSGTATDFVLASTVIQMIDEGASHFGTLAASSGGRVVRLNTSTDYRTGANVIHSFTNGVDGVLSYGVNDTVSNVVQFYNNGASSGRITYAGNAQGDTTAGHASVQSSSSVKNAFVISVTDTTTKYHAFQGFGLGRWAYGAAGSLAVKLEAEVELTLGTATGSWTAWTGSTDRHFYKVSYVYDGYQEGPLSDDFSTTSPASAAQVISVGISLKSLSTLSKRISHINLYRATSLTTTDAKPTGFYRLVGSYKLNESWKEIVDSTSNPSWGNYREKTIIDNGNVTTSYEALNGISETLVNTLPNYALSTQLNNTHFIAKCYHPDLDDASAYLFKSQPYNFDQFDWSLDLLRLPTIPTALASFQGRVYAFDENNTYRIEPNNLFIEDTFEGVGCIGPDAVVVTEYGMCFADKNNIYLHNGQTPAPIGDSILRGDNNSWQNKSSAYTPKVMFDAKRNTFVIFFRPTSGGVSTHCAWSYTLFKKRWDLWGFAITEPKGVLSGKDGELLVSSNNKLVYYLGHDSTTRAWDWTSKKLTMGQDTQVKKFKKFRTSGVVTGILGNTTGGVYVKIDGSNVTETASPNINAFKVDSTNGNYVQWFFAGQTNSVDAIGTIFRRKPVK